MYKSQSLLPLSIFQLIVLLQALPSYSQVLQDTSLGSESSIVDSAQNSQRGLEIEINGGARRGKVLFHSFDEFNIDSRSSVEFVGVAGVDNIISRVTGSHASNLFGLLKVRGNTNLFFLNSNGISFGPNSSLDISGSFLASTANGIGFPGNYRFENTDSSIIPSVSLRVPNRLFFDRITAPIRVVGNGASLLQPLDTIAPPVSLGPLPSGLSVASGSTLGLIGAEIDFQGGVLSVDSGNILLGGVGIGDVAINGLSQGGFTFDFSQADRLGDISLDQQAFINASGSGVGNITLVGKNIELLDDSLLFIENRGVSRSGQIFVDASDSFSVIGSSSSNDNLPPGFIRRFSGILSQTFLGFGPNVNIRAKNFDLLNNSTIYLSTFGSGNGGNLDIDIVETIDFSSSIDFQNLLPSSNVAISITGASGAAGDISLSASDVFFEGGSGLSSVTTGSGLGGDVTVFASNSINLAGFNAVSFSPTTIASATLGSGSGGNLNVGTGRLAIIDGARVDTSTLDSGTAGNILIGANSIFVSGSIPGGFGASVISSAGLQVDPIQEAVFGFPLNLSGDSGSITINSKEVIVSDEARLTVGNTGTGNAGTISLNSSTVNLFSGGELIATTSSGIGGNVEINSRILSLNNSSISASATGEGAGGNVFINSPLVLGFSNSRIAANAEQAEGGRINIRTLGLFGDNFPITATSDLGPQFDGQVEIDTENRPVAVDQIEVRQPVNTAVEVNCSPDGSGGQSSFAIRGAGGFPVQASNFLQTAPSKAGATNQDISVHLPFMLDKQSGEKIYLAEPQGFIRHKDGTLAFAVEAQKSNGVDPVLVSSACLNLKAES